MLRLELRPGALQVILAAPVVLGLLLQVDPVAAAAQDPHQEVAEGEDGGGDVDGGFPFVGGGGLRRSVGEGGRQGRGGGGQRGPLRFIAFRQHAHARVPGAEGVVIAGGRTSAWPVALSSVRTAREARPYGNIRSRKDLFRGKITILQSYLCIKTEKQMMINSSTRKHT